MRKKNEKIKRILLPALALMLISGCGDINETEIDFEMRAKATKNQYQTNIDSAYKPTSEELKNAVSVIKYNEKYLGSDINMHSDEQIADMYDAAYVLKLSDIKEYKELSELVINEIDTKRYQKMDFSDKLIFIEDEIFEHVEDGWTPSKEIAKEAFENIKQNKGFLDDSYKISAPNELLLDLYNDSLILKNSTIEEYHNLGEIASEIIINKLKNSNYVNDIDYLNHQYSRLRKSGHISNKDDCVEAKLFIENNLGEIDKDVTTIDYKRLIEIYKASLILELSDNESYIEFGLTCKDKIVNKLDDYIVYQNQIYERNRNDNITSFIVQQNVRISAGLH